MIKSSSYSLVRFFQYDYLGQDMQMITFSQKHCFEANDVNIVTKMEMVTESGIQKNKSEENG